MAILIGLIPLANPFDIFDELRLLFLILQQINPREPLEDDPIVIIDIDDESLNNLGQWSSRDLLSKLVQQTEQALLRLSILFWAKEIEPGAMFSLNSIQITS